MADRSGSRYVNQSSEDQLYPLNPWPATLMTRQSSKIKYWINALQPTGLKLHHMLHASFSLVECCVLVCSSPS